MDFGILPPEVNSGLMYSGPGAGPMMAAAAGWENLASELSSISASYSSVVTGLTSGPWLGPASAHLAAAAAPHLAWLSNAALQAEEAGAQAAAAAGAYEAAFATTVPPAVVAANRALLMELLATNVFGQNTPAIAATEAQYAEMWAQDAAAMYGYAGASAAASTLTPFTEPAPATSSSGLVSQAAAVSQAAGSAAATNVQGLSQLTTGMPATLNSLAAATPWGSLQAITDALGLTGHTLNEGGTGIVVGGVLGDLVEAFTGSSTLDAGTLNDLFLRYISPSRLLITEFKDIVGLAHEPEKLISAAAKAAEGAAKAVPAAAVEAVEGAGLAGGGGIASAVGRAASLGGLSVPASWVSAAPAASPAAASLVSSVTPAAAAAEAGTHTMGGVPFMGGAGRGMSSFAAPRYGVKLTVMPQLPVGG